MFLPSLTGAPMTKYDAEFEEHIRDLLSNLYDYLRLVENPVAQQLTQAQRGGERMLVIREAVLAAIEELRRENTGRQTSRQNRLYNLLLLRYVEEQGTTEVLNQLALSERQYYREHQRALQTISRVIWDKHFAGVAETGAISLADELDYLSIERGPTSFDVGAEIQAALRSTLVIAEQRGVAIQVDEADAPIRLSVPQPVFRQMVIVLLNDLIGATIDGGRIAIKLSAEAGQPQIRFAGPSAMQELFERLLKDSTAVALLKSLSARLDYVAEPPHITMSFRQRVLQILIVDDNPDTIGLFKRYLANLPYTLLAAQTESEALRIAQETALHCIILDVMLPGVDGWQILQRFKNQPTTAAIPVLICSVLAMEELALSLGADGYMNKPPSREELLAVLSAWAR